jgi:hypothetical protein
MTNSLSDAQLELSWRAQTTNTDLGNKVPTLSLIQCNKPLDLLPELQICEEGSLSKCGSLHKEKG